MCPPDLPICAADLLPDGLPKSAGDDLSAGDPPRSMHGLCGHFLLSGHQLDAASKARTLHDVSTGLLEPVRISVRIDVRDRRFGNRGELWYGRFRLCLVPERLRPKFGDTPFRVDQRSAVAGRYVAGGDLQGTRNAESAADGEPDCADSRYQFDAFHAAYAQADLPQTPPAKKTAATTTPTTTTAQLAYLRCPCPCASTGEETSTYPYPDFTFTREWLKWPLMACYLFPDSCYIDIGSRA